MDKAVGQVIAQTQAQQRQFVQRLKELENTNKRMEAIAERIERALDAMKQGGRRKDAA